MTEIMGKNGSNIERGKTSTTGKMLMVLAIIGGIIGLFVLLVMLFPGTFYDKFLYKYYIKSFLEDGKYNPIDTTTYGLMIAVAIFGISQMLWKFGIKVDHRGIYCIMPWIFMGGTYRVLEDSEYFQKPAIYFFRSPIIYFTIAMAVILVLLYATWTEVLSRRKGRWKMGTGMSWGLLAFFNILYTIYYLSTDRGISYQFTPLFPILLSLPLGLFIYIDSRRRGYADLKTNILASGLYFLGMSALPIAIWPNIGSWTTHYEIFHNPPDPLAWGYFILVILMTLALTLGLMGIMYLLKKKWGQLKRFLEPLAFLIIFGHFLDASATSIGMEYFGYIEKHFLPNFMMNLTGTPFAMFILKIPLVIIVIYVLDISHREDFETNQDLWNLVKMGIIILGLAPGLRDALRMAMGV